MRRYVLMTMLCGITLIGCGKKEDLPETAPVSGKVTFNGKPLTNGTVTFHPEEGKGNPGYGEIREDGSFQVTTYELHDGAVLGRHKITVEVFQSEPGGPPPLPGTESELSILPDKYAHPDTTPLRFEVRKGDNTAPLPLEE